MDDLAWKIANALIDAGLIAWGATPERLTAIIDPIIQRSLEDEYQATRKDEGRQS